MPILSFFHCESKGNGCVCGQGVVTSYALPQRVWRHPWFQLEVHLDNFLIVQVQRFKREDAKDIKQGLIQ